jgi:hypothetical protein
VTLPCRTGSALVGVIALAPLLFVLEPIRHLVESRMFTHMLLQFPMLIASGWATANLPAVERSRWFRWLDQLNVHGLLAITFASCVLAFWMIPTALDLALLSDPIRLGKYASLWAMGLMLRRIGSQICPELALFFVGSLAWMLSTVGLIYQSMPQRLCVNYLLDEQRWTGVGMVGIAAAILAGSLWRVAAGERVGNANLR